jgi:hypothetical protein
MSLVEQFGVASVGDVDVDTLEQRYLADLAASDAVHMLPRRCAAGR